MVADNFKLEVLPLKYNQNLNNLIFQLKILILTKSHCMLLISYEYKKKVAAKEVLEECTKAKRISKSHLSEAQLFCTFYAKNFSSALVLKSGIFIHEEVLKEFYKNKNEKKRINLMQMGLI